MHSINFSDNLKSFSINGDESRVIRFNPADPNILVRADAAQKRITEKQSQIESVKLMPDGAPVENPTEQVRRLLKEFDDLIREEINYIFNSDVYDTVFAGQSPLCIVGEKKEFLFEAFLKAAMPIIREGVEEFNAGGGWKENGDSNRFPRRTGNYAGI